MHQHWTGCMDQGSLLEPRIRPISQNPARVPDRSSSGTSF
ncbi:unnamed protein product [Staurois parvus]|uniref:Uncharacterized protein n=1 Tax=Staurois parvus TaxID=386267 RepID=A0ABN9E2R4_9NEOB|nr:unnamed protein product [Staurois parvus]